MVGIYFGFYDELEEISVEKEPEYMSIKNEGKTILFEV